MQGGGAACRVGVRRAGWGCGVQAGGMASLTDRRVGSSLAFKLAQVRRRAIPIVLKLKLIVPLGVLVVLLRVLIFLFRVEIIPRGNVLPHRCRASGVPTRASQRPCTVSCPRAVGVTGEVWRVRLTLACTASRRRPWLQTERHRPSQGHGPVAAGGRCALHCVHTATVRRQGAVADQRRTVDCSGAHPCRRIPVDSSASTFHRLPVNSVPARCATIHIYNRCRGRCDGDTDAVVRRQTRTLNRLELLFEPQSPIIVENTGQTIRVHHTGGTLRFEAQVTRSHLHRDRAHLCHICTGTGRWLLYMCLPPRRSTRSDTSSSTRRRRLA